MSTDDIIRHLETNREVFRTLLTQVNAAEYRWKRDQESWCLLEVICHLYDEEREDFRARTRHILEQPGNPLPSINPSDWVSSRKYMEQEFVSVLEKFLDERSTSINWLRSLENPAWHNTHIHPRFGAMTARLFLDNWLAHDYFHIRQITRIKYYYLQEHSDESLRYAGEW